MLRSQPDAYGMAMYRELERATGRDVSIGAVYATLDRLEAKDLLESSRGGGEARRRKASVPSLRHARCATGAGTESTWDDFSRGDSSGR